MTLARRFSVAAALVVALTLAVAAGVSYGLVRHLVLGEVDRTLRQQIPEFGSGSFVFGVAADPTTPGAPAVGEGVAGDGAAAFAPVGSFDLTVPSVTGLVFPEKVVLERASDWILGGGPVVGKAGLAAALLVPADASIRAVASGSRSEDIRSATFEGRRYRVITRQAGDGAVIQAGRPLAETERVLSSLLWILVGVVGAASVIAGLAARFVARAVLAPIRRLASVAQHVTSTRDLRRRVPEGGGDELGGLARTFNSMLATLDDSVRSQRQLVIDASHELRTPVASARTNLEVLRRGALSEEERDRIVDDVVGQLEELGTTIADVVELARSDAAASASEPVRLDVLVADTVRRVRVHAPTRRIDVETEPCVVVGSPERIARAVRNLLDNALKWGPPDEPVEVVVARGEVVVRDRGPGMSPDDALRAFDRFWRAPGARSLPGSGLGLAIVAQVAGDLGGTVAIERPADGGARVRLSLPWTAAEGEGAASKCAGAESALVVAR